MGTVPITVQVVRLVGNGEGVPRARAALLPAHFVWVPGVVDLSCEMARRRRAVCSSTSTDRPCILPEWTAACYGLSAPPPVRNRTNREKKTTPNRAQFAVGDHARCSDLCWCECRSRGCGEFGCEGEAADDEGAQGEEPEEDVQRALSKSDKALIKKELTGGARKTRILGGTSANATMNSATPQNSSGTCWSKGIEASRWGGITKAKLLSVTITTRVCVASGAVTSVEVSEAFQTVYSAALGWHKNGVSDSSLNAGWEGRGVGRGEFTWGAGDWDLLFTTVCGQMRLNADMVHYAGSDSCSVSG